MTTYFIGLVSVFSNRESSFLSGYQLCSSSGQLLPLFVWGRIHTGASQKHEKKLDRSDNFPFHYIGDVLSLIKLGDFVEYIYPIKVEIKVTQIQLGLRHTLIYTLKSTVSACYPDTVRSSSHIDLHLEKYSECMLSRYS